MNKQFDSKLMSVLGQNDRIPQLKQIIKNHSETLGNQFNPNENVGNLILNNACFIDSILSSCWHYFVSKNAEHLCLIATGGYGRQEMFPGSDIDILILVNTPITDELNSQLTDFSHFLWDIGLKPGQSVRSISECLEKAKLDQTIMTSLLEIRLICGCTNLFNELNSNLAEECLWSTKDFFAAKMEEQHQRYTKYHETAYNLEPNVKEGPGGIRDLQNIAWVFKHHYQTPTLKELIKFGFFSKAEYNDLIHCRNILWRIRFALHLLTGRCEDRLLFDLQRDLASQFSFTDSNQNPDVEQFMQFYFKTVMELERMNEMLLQLFNEKLVHADALRTITEIDSDFHAVNQYLEVNNPQTFTNNPIALLKAFRIMQQQPNLKGIGATTIRLIRKNLYLIDDEFRSNADANKVFIAILRTSKGITHQFRQMNRYGILAAYLPSFANIVARMQYDLFHIYTVDAHTLFVLRNLRRFSLEKHFNELPFCNSVFMKISKPEILYIAAIFHDIAKGMGGDHSVLGEQIAQDFCVQHKLPSSDTKLITWLVRNHLIMSMTAQRKDISDPDIIHEFALQVGSIQYLNHLYLFTVADIRATNPSLWNSWKDSLLLDLYTYTHSALHRGLQSPTARSERIAENKQEANELLKRLGVSKPTIKKTWYAFADDYFLRYSAEEIAWHTIAIASSLDEKLTLVILRPQNERGSVEIFVYAKNENSIFSISADTLDQLGLTILDARIITVTQPNNEQFVLNSFHVLEQSGKPIEDLARKLQICSNLKNNLENLSVTRQINIHRQSRQAKHFPITDQINFDSDPQNHQTIIEIITTDRSGLLASIGRAFIELNIQLHNAKITTIGSRVEDMFYVTCDQSKPIEDYEKLEEIKNTLQKVLKD